MSCYIEKIVTPNDLENRTILQTNITVQRSDEVLLTGTVFGEQCEPLQGTVIQIIRISGRNRISIGYVITNQDGEFAIAVAKNNRVKYQLDVYGPLITG